jgi:aryl-alcohol dehydrogenase-like predicted oxidoreductase
MSVEKRKFCGCDLEVSMVGLGTNNFGRRMDREAARPVIHKALDLGITHFDTADIYANGSSETIIGEVLGSRRKEAVLATKFGKRMADNDAPARGARSYVLSAVEASLKRLQTSWIDLLWMHEPDPNTPIEETFAAVEELKKAGKVRHLAASNFSAAELDEAAATAKRMGVAGFIACQDEYSLLTRGIESTIYRAMERNQLRLVPYFPLAGGALTGKYRKGEALPQGSRHSGGSGRFLDPNWDKIANLTIFAEARGHTLLELAMSWLAHRPPVASIIAGATTTEQVEANAKSVEWDLAAAEMAEIDRLTL